MTVDKYLQVLKCVFYVNDATSLKDKAQNWLAGDKEEAAQNGRMRWLKALKVYNAPQSILRRRAPGKNKMIVCLTWRCASWFFNLL